jgi:hypothetical protein
MKANELRIGNLIFFPKGDVHKVNYETIRLLYTTNQPIYHNPIPLTEEWLLKFGFEKYDTNKYSINHFYIRKIGDEFETEVGECLYKTIDYVHQLQNLYFALTDEELTMK